MTRSLGDYVKRRRLDILGPAGRDQVEGAVLEVVLRVRFIVQVPHGRGSSTRRKSTGLSCTVPFIYSKLACIVLAVVIAATSELRSSSDKEFRVARLSQFDRDACRSAFAVSLLVIRRAVNKFPRTLTDLANSRVS